MTSVRDATGAESSDSDRPLPENRPRVRAISGRRPSGWRDRVRGVPAVPIVATGAAWVGLGIASLVGSTDQPPGHTHTISTASGLLVIAVMTVAMMGPLTIPGARAVASPVSGHGHGPFFGAVSFCATFLGVWIVIAICLQPVAATVTGVVGSVDVGAALLLAICAAGQFDPRRRDPIRGSGEQPTTGDGARDALVAARSGGSAAIGDIRFCGLPMLAMLAVPGSLPAMAAITALTVLDRAIGRSRSGVAAGYLVLAGALFLF